MTLLFCTYDFHPKFNCCREAPFRRYPFPDTTTGLGFGAYRGTCIGKWSAALSQGRLPSHHQYCDEQQFAHGISVQRTTKRRLDPEYYQLPISRVGSLPKTH